MRERGGSGGIRSNLLYASGVGVGVGVGYGRSNSSTGSGSGAASLSHHHHHNLLSSSNINNTNTTFHLHNFHPTVKTEGNHHPQIFQYPLMSRPNLHHTMQLQAPPDSSDLEAIKAKIIAHPHYSNLLQAYMDCHKVHPAHSRYLSLSLSPRNN